MVSGSDYNLERFFSLWVPLKDGLVVGLCRKTASQADGEDQTRDHGTRTEVTELAWRRTGRDVWKVELT